MTSLLNISNPAKLTYTDDDEYVAGIEPYLARYVKIGTVIAVYLNGIQKPPELPLSSTFILSLRHKNLY